MCKYMLFNRSMIKLLDLVFEIIFYEIKSNIIIYVSDTGEQQFLFDLIFYIPVNIF